MVKGFLSEKQSSGDLRKLYNNLQKEHERVGTAFQSLQEQNEELAWDLAEREADLEELTNLVSTKDEVIKNVERRLLQVKKSHSRSEGRGPVTP